MNNFKVEIKEKDEWNKVSAVFPYISGDLLDERLDEASVTFFSRTKAYSPLTEFRITFYKNQDLNQPDSDSQGKNVEYFILANDNSAEYPSGSGLFKHETYLIERTKLLEGVLCPSITFTNAKQELYSSVIQNRVYATSFSDAQPLPSTFDGISQITSPILESRIYLTPSVTTVGQAVADAAGRTYYSSAYDSSLEQMVYSTYDIYLDGILIAGSLTDVYQISVSQLFKKNKLRLDYTVVCGRYSVAAQSYIYNRYYVRFEVDILEQFYPLKPYTITDCVVRVLELAEPLLAGERPRFTFEGCILDGNGSVSGYEAGSQAERYSKINAPEFSMTQATLREQLKVIGSYIHAEPWLDENNVVHFLDLGAQEQATGVPEGRYISNTLKTDINSYCTEIRSNAQNLVNSLGYAKGAIIDPGNGLYRSLRCETMYVRISAENGIAATDLPIYSVEKVTCGLFGIASWKYEPKDITPYVFEATEYGSNLSSFGGGYPYSKQWAIYYTQGQKGLRGLFYQDPDAVSAATYSPFAIANILAAVNGVAPDEVYDALVGTVADFLDPKSNVPNLVFQITYKPIAPGFISHGKQYYISGEQTYSLPYNQGENLIETQYFGENMKGVAARLGNIEQVKTFLLSSRSQIPRVGTTLDGYAISAVNTEYMPNYIKCTLGLSKDYNRISEYVGINSVKRMYEISERQAVKRVILIKENIVITSDPNMADDPGVFFLRKEAILGAFAGSEEDLTVKFAIMYGYSKKDGEWNGKSIFLPVLGRSFGNTIHFAVQFKDNYSAGDCSERVTESGVEGNWQNDVPYTDYYGRLYWCKLMFPFSYRLERAEGTSLPFQLPKGFYLNDASMEGTHSSANTLGGLVGDAPLRRIRKDNREILGFNVEAEFKTAEDDIVIGSELAARCRYLTSSSTAPNIYASKKPINKLSKYEPDCILISTGNAPSNYYSTFSINTGSNPGDNYLDVSINVKDLYEAGYRSWFIATPTVVSTEEYVDEEENIVTGTVYTGGEILLGGSIIKSAGDTPIGDLSGGRISRKLYFVTKRR